MTRSYGSHLNIRDPKPYDPLASIPEGTKVAPGQHIGRRSNRNVAEQWNEVMAWARVASQLSDEYNTLTNLDAIHDPVWYDELDDDDEPRYLGGECS